MLLFNARMIWSEFIGGEIKLGVKMAKLNLSQKKIAAAEELLGISYTSDEREQMLSNLEGQILSAKARRSVELNNDSPMASRFDPRLPHFSMPREDGYIESECNDKIPQSDEQIAFSSVRQQASWIERGEITSRRLVEIYLDRIDRYSANLECFTVVLAAEALKEADAMDALMSVGMKLSPLHGIPYGLKDLFDTNGIITGWGAEPYKNRVPSADAEIVKKLRGAGAILIAKTSVGALAYNDIWYGGRTRNPWNTSEGSSGSSAGSASATAAGLCSFSIGTETLGSITSPSNRCGATGLRPTFGRVSRRGGMALCWSLDKVGPICRYVEDTGRVLSVLNGYDPGDLGSIEAPFSFDARATSKNLRVGYLAKAFGDGANQIDHNALAAVKSLGFKVNEVELEDLPYMSLINILYAEAAAAFEHLTLTNQDDTLTWQDEGAWPNTFRKARFLSAVDHVQLDRLRFLAMKAMDNLFTQVDVLVGPFDTGPMLVATNFTGHPCVHIRSGFSSLASRGAASLGSGKLDTGSEGRGQKYRVPQGFSIWGGLFKEGEILSFAMKLEKKLSVAGEKPVLRQIKN